MLNDFVSSIVTPQEQHTRIMHHLKHNPHLLTEIRRGVTQVEISRRAMVPQPYVSRLEMGHFEAVPLNYMITLLKVYAELEQEQLSVKV